ncbi:tetraacyldisaccharide 4'-kinase [Sneathiella limimaris]|uniref:tetraacyldisaccharide 4'-kinase n=1 Tax=Sneathiella limimaris TaxID=1964213 RepID=UPI00146C0AC8
MKAPKFWNSNRNSIWPVVLSPLSFIYGFASRVRFTGKRSKKVSVPVICIGNVVAGGAGKTPVAMAVAEYLKQIGWKVHFLSRGYGGSLAGPERVVLDVHTADQVGDEPLLLATVAPTWISRDRVIGAEAAIEAGAEIIVMDDGMQNPLLEKDITVLVLDGGYGLGNGWLMPSGPLRERFSEALKKADFAVWVEGDLEQPLDVGTLPLFKARVVPHELQSELVGEKVIAFAGIGRPEKFFRSLRQAGAELVETVEFADHHAYSQEDIMNLVERAALHNAALVTTRKDYVRLSPEARMMTTVFDIDLVFESPALLQKLLLEKLGSREHA